MTIRLLDCLEIKSVAGLLVLTTRHMQELVRERASPEDIIPVIMEIVHLT